MQANVAQRLLQHYVDKSRDLPWRSPPGSPAPGPYRVWLSEVMLQQTTVAAVAPRFERFVARWPTIDSLAKAADEEILSEWAGLGYYARARNLIACARAVEKLGAFPQTLAELRKLPGIGDYTAAAIAAIAFGETVAVVDTNVERVASRLFALARAGKNEIRDRVASMVPRGRAGDFAQAMMDLGATLCRPRNPRCGECPLSRDCKAFAIGAPDAYPAPREKRQRPVRHGIALWIERDGEILLVRRPSNGMLGGMAALPGPEWTGEPVTPRGPVLARIRHVFTHFALDLAVVASTDEPAGGWWQSLDSAAEAGLPTLYRRAVEAVLANGGRLAA